MYLCLARTVNKNPGDASVNGRRHRGCPRHLYLSVQDKDHQGAISLSFSLLCKCPLRIALSRARSASFPCGLWICDSSFLFYATLVTLEWWNMLPFKRNRICKRDILTCSIMKITLKHKRQSRVNTYWNELKLSILSALWSRVAIKPTKSQRNCFFECGSGSNSVAYGIL